MFPNLVEIPWDGALMATAEFSEIFCRVGASKRFARVNEQLRRSKGLQTKFTVWLSLSEACYKCARIQQFTSLLRIEVFQALKILPFLFETNDIYTRVWEFWNAHPPPSLGRMSLAPSRTTASKHGPPHTFQFTVRVRVRVRVGWRASGATAKPPY